MNTLGSRPALLRTVVSRLWFKDGKNWDMSKVRVLVDFFFTYLDLTMCVRATPASMVDLNLSPPSWHGWMKLFFMTVN